MKKIKHLFMIFLIPILLITGCGKGKDKGNTEPPKSSDGNNVTYAIKDFYPFKENIKMKYKGIGNEYAGKTIFTDYIKDDRIQIRVITGGTTSAQVLEVKDGELRLITSKGEFYHRENIIAAENKDYEILLKEPLAKGTTWTLPNGSKRFISSLEKEIETPAGKFKALEVTTENTEHTSYDYYVLNKGFVQSIYKAKDMEVITTLESIEENQPVVQTVKFYYPNYAEDKIYFVKKTLNFKTNEDIKSILEKNFKETPNENLNKLLGGNATINKVYLDSASNTVKIDFSDNFVKEMNAGSGLEMAILKCITNTLGDYFNVDKAMITIGGKPYSSGHIYMKENETSKIDLQDAIEFKK